jgi:hypothetical protein
MKMSTSYFFKVFLLATAVAVCQAGIVSANSLGKVERKGKNKLKESNSNSQNLFEQT